MAKSRPYALSCAGFDPSAGAGILADIKAMEQLKVYGMGLITCQTVQHDRAVVSVEPVEQKLIKAQLECLAQQFSFPYAKIGLCHSPEMVIEVIEDLRHSFPAIRIIWDPIFKTSSGLEVWNQVSSQTLKQIFDLCFIVTPNLPEWEKMRESVTEQDLFSSCHVYLKGGHHATEKGRDYLYTTSKKNYAYKASKLPVTEKHGSGCILSAALTAMLSRGFSLHEAALKAKQYTARALSSNPTLLAYHHR